MDVPTDRVTMTLVVATAAIGLIGYVVAFRVQSGFGGLSPAVVGVAGVVIVAIVVAATWFGLDRLD